jgi:hypothetical protein
VLVRLREKPQGRDNRGVKRIDGFQAISDISSSSFSYAGQVKTCFKDNPV